MPLDKKPLPSVTDPTYVQWASLDVIMLHYIYSTIFIDLLTTIMEPRFTALDAQKRLTNLFQDNQNPRVATLKHEFSGVHMETFPNVYAYCSCMKKIFDQLWDVISPMYNHCLVLQLIFVLTDSYQGVATLTRQSNSLPLFHQAR